VGKIKLNSGDSSSLVIFLPFVVVARIEHTPVHHGNLEILTWHQLDYSGVLVCYCNRLNKVNS
jgi:hypothetical protein